MAEITFSSDERDLLTQKIQTYFEEELDHEIGMFEAQFLLDFFSKEIGPFYYNEGLHDAQALMEKTVESISDGVYELEKPVQFRR